MPTSPPITGLAQLGSVLLDAGQTYARNSRQDQLMERERKQRLDDETRRREQHLQDVRETRTHEYNTRQQGRTERMQDDLAANIARGTIALRQTLMMEGLLTLEQATDPKAVQEAFLEFQRRGLEKQYQELFSTPGPNGRPLLTQEQLTDPVAVRAAKDALGQLKAQQVQGGLDQRTNAQGMADDTQAQLAQVRARAAAIAAKIDEPPPQFSATSSEVLQLASQMAEQSKPGTGRNREAIALMVPTAQKQLNEQAYLRHAQTVQSASRELESLRYQEAQMTAALRETMQTFKVAPGTRAPAPAALQSPTASTAPKAATSQDIAAAINQLTGAQRAPANGGPEAPPSGSTLLENPSGNPVITRGNEAMQQQQSAQLQATLNATIREGEQIDVDLSRAARQVSPAPLGAVGGGMIPYRAPDPILAAQETADLLKKKAANDARIRQLRAQLQGPLAAGSTAPSVNTAMESVPAGVGAQWWLPAPSN